MECTFSKLETGHLQKTKDRSPLGSFSIDNNSNSLMDDTSN